MDALSVFFVSAAKFWVCNVLDTAVGGLFWVKTTFAVTK